MPGFRRRRQRKTGEDPETKTKEETVNGLPCCLWKPVSQKSDPDTGPGQGLSWMPFLQLLCPHKSHWTQEKREDGTGRTKARFRESHSDRICFPFPCDEHVETRSPLARWVGMYNGAATMENGMELPEKIKNRTAE